jgi:hypothetical protein
MGIVVRTVFTKSFLPGYVSRLRFNLVNDH